MTLLTRPFLRRAGSGAVRWMGLLALAACSGGRDPGHHAAAKPPRAAITPTANVPALVGSNIEELSARLGPAQLPPATFLDPGRADNDEIMAAEDSLVAFHTGGLVIIANFDTHTRRVHDLLLLGPHEDSLMARASLRPDATGYLVLPVFRPERPNKLLGLRVVATNSQ